MKHAHLHICHKTRKQKNQQITPSTVTRTIAAIKHSLVYLSHVSWCQRAVDPHQHVFVGNRCSQGRLVPLFAGRGVFRRDRARDLPQSAVSSDGVRSKQLVDRHAFLLRLMTRQKQTKNEEIKKRRSDNRQFVSVGLEANRKICGLAWEKSSRMYIPKHKCITWAAR